MGEIFKTRTHTLNKNHHSKPENHFAVNIPEPEAADSNRHLYCLVAVTIANHYNS